MPERDALVQTAWTPRRKNLSPAQLEQIARGHENVAEEYRRRAEWFELLAEDYRREARQARVMRASSAS